MMNLTKKEEPIFDVIPIRNVSFNIHLTGINGPLGMVLGNPTGRCMFVGPVYYLPPLKAPFAVYAGYVDSLCEDVIFIAVLYGDATPTTIEGEIRVYHVVSGEDMHIKELSASEIDTMLTFNRRALHTCVFWAKLRNGRWDEDASATQEYARLEALELVRLFKKSRKMTLPKVNIWKNYGWSPFRSFWCIPLRNDGFFLDINAQKDLHRANLPIDFSVSVIRIYKNTAIVAFISLPASMGLLRFLEKFICFEPDKKIGVFDSVLGICCGKAQKKGENIYKVRVHSKWNTTVEIQIINNQNMILKHRYKGTIVMEREMKFCKVCEQGITFPEGLLPESYKTLSLKETTMVSPGGENIPALEAPFLELVEHDSLPILARPNF